jgi:hypothetical protein
MYQRFPQLRGEEKIISHFIYKQYFEFIVIIYKLGVRFAKTNGNH